MMIKRIADRMMIKHLQSNAENLWHGFADKN